ncbi:TPA: hypothetical protein EYP66_20000 [Candidatus Poribacteria bacterium]|nr:hypothetical protein [Candidatus Poribacteria bacterium]
MRVHPCRAVDSSGKPGVGRRINTRYVRHHWIFRAQQRDPTDRR